MPKYMCHDCGTELQADNHQEVMLLHARTHHGFCSEARNLHDAINDMSCEIKRLRK